MAIKQKISSLVTILGLFLGVTFLFCNTSVMAQPIEPGIINPETGEVMTKDDIDEANRKRDAQRDCEPGEDGCCGGVKTSIIGGEICGNNEGESVIFNLLVWVLRIMTAGVGIAAVGGIGYGALLYTTAEGKPEQTKKAIGIITNVVIGIGAYAFMAIILNFLIPGGVFG